MEPKLPSPDRRPELPSVNSTPNQESYPQHNNHEASQGRSVEYQERQSEAVPSGENVHAPVVNLPAPVASPVADDDAVTLPQVSNDTPAIAGDDELIEKEWVDKAKKVIAETKDDPYRREQEVSKLQADYLFKRYGRKLGSPQ